MAEEWAVQRNEIVSRPRLPITTGSDGLQVRLMHMLMLSAQH